MSNITTTAPIVVLLESFSGKELPRDFQKDYHTHLLCRGGRASFLVGDSTLECGRGEFAFLLAGDGTLRDLAFSSDFRATVLLVEQDFMNDNVPDLNWGIDAVLHARKHPVKRLDAV